ncbi:MAG: DUF1152 domain-containing protein [Pseudomonadota bacterium]|nr:DUF1152 domain-containing protein [Pseudomonadota bacterium]
MVPIELKPHSNILIAGCGGGFDVIAAGVPIGLALEKLGHNVIYSSYSFTRLAQVIDAESISINSIQLLLIDAETQGPQAYFPEKYLAQWYKKYKNAEKKIYCYSGIGVQPLISIFDYIQKRERIDYLFIVDGGCDGILRGDEFDLGTPEIDSVSVVAGEQCAIKAGFYVLSAFGTEGVAKTMSHAQVLERMSELVSQNAFYGVTSIFNDVEIKSDYVGLFEYISEQMGIHNKSTIMASIVHSLQGDFGDTVINHKTAFAPVWISVLTSLLWFFNLDSVAKMKLNYTQLLATNDFIEVFQLFGLNFSTQALEKKPRIPI